jgi:hypothetical protein
MMFTTAGRHHPPTQHLEPFIPSQAAGATQVLQGTMLLHLIKPEPLTDHD